MRSDPNGGGQGWTQRGEQGEQGAGGRGWSWGLDPKGEGMGERGQTQMDRGGWGEVRPE